ncbi:hypothetical protein TIFTF001_010496 [Ficus carica]|uniref:Uncharacterized protein n=1 Tax=Ficus carica TaxID=3494 RepID=A0AA88D4K3_FICCA|nr:hypothetical protein TIFTF001_010496 [Ficus carica]
MPATTEIGYGVAGGYDHGDGEYKTAGSPEISCR